MGPHSFTEERHSIPADGFQISSDLYQPCSGHPPLIPLRVLTFSQILLRCSLMAPLGLS